MKSSRFIKLRKYFICDTPDFMSYADIYNTRALVELSGEGVGPAPEPSYGTHFFQDLIESRIYPLAVHLDDHEA